MSVQLRSILKPADNSGAKRLMVIGISGRVGKKASLGQVVRCVVDGADPVGAVKDSEPVTVVIVRAKKEIKRRDGTYVRFDDNAGVIVDRKTKEPKGTRILGPVARELRAKGFQKIISLAPEVL